MLQTGRRLLEREGLADRVELRHGDITTFDAQLPERVDAVSCMFAIDHLPTEEVASRCLQAIAHARAFNDAIASEQAAFAADELTAPLERAGLGDLRHLRSRPLGEYQAHWAPGSDQSSPTTGLWRDAPLPPETRLLARIVLQSFPRSVTRA